MITVLRLGHRVGRDDRISTHCGLVARALGANAIIYTGDHDDGMVAGIKKVTDRFGGHFDVGYQQSWKKVIADFKMRGFKIVHLTIYGMPLQEKISQIKKEKDILLVVGGEKVPPEIYQLADYNIGVTSQPHSEIGALAICLYDLIGDKALKQTFEGSKIRIIPQEKGKKVEED